MTDLHHPCVLALFISFGVVAAMLAIIAKRNNHLKIRIC